MTQETPAAYFASLTIENVKCFKEKQTINLSNGNDEPAMWTVILGNNNTGKTTLLRCLADLEAIKDTYIFNVDDSDKCDMTFKGNLKQMNRDKYFFSSLFYKIDDEKKQYIKSSDWGWTRKGSTVAMSSKVSNFIIYGYGTNRRTGETSLSEAKNQDNSASLFSNKVALLNAEEWLLQVDYASKNGIKSAKFRLDKIKAVFTSGILPDVKNFKCVSTEINNQISNFVECKTDYGWIRLHDLGYGYQSMTAWIVDLAQKMFERYPESDNPLHEPAIVLIDEIDLHLHPEWQRTIIKYLSDLFPKTQFIVTAHSPLIVQSAENINLVILEKQDDHVVINQPDLTTYEGWTVEEILKNLMGLNGKTKSKKYSSLIKEFNKAIAKDNYLIAKETYDKLDKLLHHNNIQRELLELQLSSLSQETA